jgi:anthranilate phosphoribosyltransferase
MKITALLNELTNGYQLDELEAKNILLEIISGNINETQMIALISAFSMRSISIAELKGFKNAMLSLAKPIDTEGLKTIDVCGTGGDGKNTFNISTTSSFVLAAMGIPVAKHGNYGVSSISGSSNVLEQLGIPFKMDAESIVHDIQQHNIGFIHAPYFHPALKQIGALRKALGVRTFFNMLGPLVNPAKPMYRSNGVFNLELLRKYHFIYQQEGNEYSVFYDTNGFDEISLTATAKCYSTIGEQLIDAHSFGLKKINEQALSNGNSITNATKILINVLKNEATEAQINVVAANAAIAYHTVKKIPIQEAFELAIETIKSKKAFLLIKKLSNTKIKVNL